MRNSLTQGPQWDVEPKDYVYQQYFLHNFLFAEDQVVITQDNNDEPYLTWKLMEE